MLGKGTTSVVPSSGKRMWASALRGSRDRAYGLSRACVSGAGLSATRGSATVPVML